MGIQALFVLLPYPALYTAAVLFVITMGVAYLSKKLAKVGSEDLPENKQCFFPSVFGIWFINEVALIVSTVVVFAISNFVPFLSKVNSEWGIPYEKAYLPAAICAIIWLAIYGSMLLLSKSLLKNKILDKVKLKKFVTLYVSFCCAALLIAIILVYFV